MLLFLGFGNDAYFLNDNIFARSVLVVGSHTLYLLYHVHTTYHFAKDGVTIVEVGRPPIELVSLSLLGSVLASGASLQFIKIKIGKVIPRYNVELRRRRGLFRIHLIPFASRT